MTIPDLTRFWSPNGAADILKLPGLDDVRGEATADWELPRYHAKTMLSLAYPWSVVRYRLARNGLHELPIERIEEGDADSAKGAREAVERVMLGLLTAHQQLELMS